jgi:hypothetical protein
MVPDESMTSPRNQAERIAGLLGAAQRECRENIENLGDPQARAVFETIAEVLQGQITALRHYIRRSEVAWQEPPQQLHSDR